MQAISPIQRAIYKLHVGGQCCMDLKLSATNISTTAYSCKILHTSCSCKFCIQKNIKNIWLPWKALS